MTAPIKSDYRLFMKESEIASIMRVQFRVWNSIPDAVDALDDTCHAYANALGYDPKTRMADRKRFFIECGSLFYD